MNMLDVCANRLLRVVGTTLFLLTLADASTANLLGGSPAPPISDHKRMVGVWMGYDDAYSFREDGKVAKLIFAFGTRVKVIGTYMVTGSTLVMKYPARKHRRDTYIEQYEYRVGNESDVQTLLLRAKPSEEWMQYCRENNDPE